MTIAAHPYADILPLLSGEPFNLLVADIKASGLLEPIALQKASSMGAIAIGRARPQE
jgi:hypothetical protein